VMAPSAAAVAAGPTWLVEGGRAKYGSRATPDKLQSSEHV
jgi:hypothetical protein